MIGVLLKPRSFIAENLKHKYSLKRPFLIVFCISIFGGISGVLMMQKLLQNLPQEVHPVFLIGSGIGLIFGILGGMVMWAIITAFFHISALLMDGSGDYRKLLELVGYSQLPLIFSAGIALVMVVSSIPELSMKMVQDKVAMEQAFLGIPAFKASMVFGRLMLFWSLFLSAIAVREVHSISNKKAASSILIPIILYVGITELIKRWFTIG